MSVRKDGKTIAGTTVNPDLFDFKWADHILNDISWVRADTFSWQDGNFYTALYNHLSADANGKTPQTETISGVTITYYLADDGHKVVGPNEESNVVAIYNATGVAWYYILDEINHRFKLPRTKFGFTGMRNGVGKYVAPGLPDHTHNIKYRQNDATGYHANGTYIPHLWTSGYTYRGDTPATKGASETNPIYGASTTVQPPATQMYLYFYAGNYTPSAVAQTAGVTAETLNNKADITAVGGFAMPNYQNMITLSNLDSYQQIQEDGYIVVTGNGNGNWSDIGFHISLDGTTSTIQMSIANMYFTRFIVPVQKGVYIKRRDSQTTSLTFIPCCGNN